jgi:hypothetical protein
MRHIVLMGVLALACGCRPVTESILESILDDVIVYDPPVGAATASRLAFVTAEDGSVTCYILDGGSSDHVMAITGAQPNGIAVGTSGAIFVSTGEDVVSLDSAWSDLETLPVDVATVDGIAADAGTVVVAGRTEDGAVVLVYDEASGRLVGQSAPVQGVTITNLTAGNGTAFAVEEPTREIVSYDLTSPAPARNTVVGAEVLKGDPLVLVVGNAGSLLVAGTAGAVEQVDAATGEVEGTLFSWDPSAPPVGLAFDHDRDQYLLLTADDVVRVIDDRGRVVETRESPLVRNATAIALLGR